MTKQELLQVYKKLDSGKMKLFQKGIAFDFTLLMPNGDFAHCGIGTAADMTHLALITLCDLWRGAKRPNATPEEFAEGLKLTLIDYIKKREERLENDGGESTAAHH